jgi:hypothetical protein
LAVDIVFVVGLCKELGKPLDLPCIVLEDNQPVIDVTSEVSGRVKRCKHFLMLVSYVRELVSEGLIALEKVHTSENIADILTKVVTGQEFRTKSELLCNDKY